MHAEYWGRTLRRPAGLRWLTAVLALGLVLCVGAPRADAAAPAGGLAAFGDNTYGELGVTANAGTATANPTPAPVGLPGENGTATSAAAGDEYSLVVTSSGQLYGFGLNELGQLGSTTNNGSSNANVTPTLVSLPGAIGGATQVSSGGDDSLVVTSSGQLYGFGDNNFGQLGTTTNNGNNDPNPTPTLITLPGQTGSVTQVAAGDAHSLVLTASGQVYSFGLNDDGQLGVATNSDTTNANPTPTLIGLPGQIGTVSEIAAGDDYSVVLTSSGQVFTFGDNDSGELGTSLNSGTNEANPTPTQVTFPGLAGTVTQITAGDEHVLAATSGNQLYAFGDNDDGELGSTANVGTLNANPTPALVSLPGLTGTVTQIAAGDDDSLVVTSSGQLYSFGLNYSGQLGNATDNGSYDANPAPTLVSFTPGTTIDTVARGAFAEHTLAIVSDLSVSSSSLPTATVAQAYNATVATSGGTAPLSFTATGLPTGLTINATTGTISGTPSTTSSSPVAITVTDAYGSQSSATLTLTVSPASMPTPTTGAPTTTAPTFISPPAVVSKLTRLVIAPGTVSLTGHTVKGKCVATTSKNRRDRPCAFAIKLTAGYTASATTTLYIHLALLRTGRKSGKSCVAQTKKNTKLKECTRVTALKGQLTHAVTKSGTGTFTLTRTFAGHKLAAGKYRITVTPKGGVARTATFTITR